jgi:hypothetical protein
LAVSPEIALVYEPLVVVPVVLEELVVGFADVDQHTPLTVIVAPPFEVILPPLEAVVCVMEDGDVVVKAGIVARVVNETSFPYPVPALLYA